MSILQHFGFQRQQKPDKDVVSALVDDVVDHAMQQAHEARVAIRSGNGKVIDMVQSALGPDRDQRVAKA